MEKANTKTERKSTGTRTKNRARARSRSKNLTILFLIISTAIAFSVIKNSRMRRINAEISVPQISNVKTNDIKTKKVRVYDIDISNELMLVNSEHTLDERDKSIDKSIIVSLTAAYGVIPLSTSEIKINDIALKAVDRMFTDAKEKGYKNFIVTSGFRSYQMQKETFDSAEDKSYVQKPGASEHQTGYAIDIAYTGLKNERFDSSKQGKWLKENAYKYGFILRYPEDKTELTQISYEPWHYRYVGLPHAYYCYQNSICLEEYINTLAEGGSYSLSIDRADFTVYYETEKDGFINIPIDSIYSVSSDNMGGFIIVIKDLIKE